MDYFKALELSSKPHITLAQAFTHITGQIISTRLVQKLMNQYDEKLILEAIMSMKGREVDSPVPYLLGVCRNMQIRLKRDRLVTAAESFERTFRLFNEKNLAGDRPALRSPFDDTGVAA